MADRPPGAGRAGVSRAFVAREEEYKVMYGRVFNFNPGPAALPVPVLEQVRDELLNFSGTGMSATNGTSPVSGNQAHWVPRIVLLEAM